MEANGRIYGKKAVIDSENVKTFFNNNAKKDTSLKSVLLGNDFGENSADLHKRFYCMPATDIDRTRLLEKYDVVIVTGVSMYINDSELVKLYNHINSFTKKDSFLYIQDTTSLLETRLTLKDFDSIELNTKYNAIYRTKTEYETLFGKYLPAFKLAKNGTELLLDKDSGAREETNARYWCFRKE